MGEPAKTRAPPCAAGARAYRPSEPEPSLLRTLVAAEAKGLRAQLAAEDPDGRALPRHVDRELDGFLECGQLRGGFLRVVCLRCREERLVAFRCKGRGLCPSCAGRRMADTAAHLVDRVLPRSDYRQWVVTFPRRVRALLAVDPGLQSAVLTEVVRAIFGWQREKARALGEKPARARSTGAIGFLQRFNSAWKRLSSSTRRLTYVQ